MLFLFVCILLYLNGISDLASVVWRALIIYIGIVLNIGYIIGWILLDWYLYSLVR